MRLPTSALLRARRPIVDRLHPARVHSTGWRRRRVGARSSASRCALRPIRPTVVLLLGLWLAGCTPGASPAASNAPAFSPCQLAAVGFPARLAAECVELDVPLDRDDASGRAIALRVARIPARTRSPAPDAVTLLAGGPGQAATEAWVPLSGALSELGRRRDIVLVDQRGTGGSFPLDCPEHDADDVGWEPSAQARAARRCLDLLPAGPEHFTTVQAVDDLEAVRRTLGYPELNLIGVSYGTRVALTYAREYPQRVRSMILDGVVPQDEALGEAVAISAQAALDAWALACREDADCAALAGDPQDDLRRIMATLRAAPRPVALDHPTDGRRTTVTLGPEAVAITVRLLLYAPETAVLLPLLLQRAADGEFAALTAQYLLVTESLATSIHDGMSYAVSCSEDVPFFGDAPSQPTGEVPFLGSVLVDALRAVCAEWPRAELPADFKSPVRSDVPSLLLSGALDPVTPPAYGHRVAEGLTRSRHIVVPGHGHNVVARGCIPRVVGSFIADVEPAAVDASCVERMSAPPFFVSPTGPVTVSRSLAPSPTGGIAPLGYLRP